MRIYKHYNFNVEDKATSAKRISFSSYPGLYKYVPLESNLLFYLFKKTVNCILDNKKNIDIKFSVLDMFLQYVTNRCIGIITYIS
jgi:hypothetical protein